MRIQSFALLLALIGCRPADPLDALVVPDAGIFDAALPLPADACLAGLRAAEGYRPPQARPAGSAPPSWPPAGLAACSNGVDDDGDDRADHPLDPGCSTAADIDETDPPVSPACDNGIDDDGDGRVDWPDDPTCIGRGGPSERFACPFGPVFELEGEQGEIDAPIGGEAPPETRHAGCAAPVGSATVFSLDLAEPRSLAVEVLEDSRDYIRASLDETQIAVTTDCTDAAAGLACVHGSSLFVPQLAAGPVQIVIHGPGPVVSGDESRSLAPPRRVRWHLGPPGGADGCRDGVDNDADGQIDGADPGCRALDDPWEHDPPTPPACFDGVDRDADGRADYPIDPECRTAGAASEARCPDDGVPLLAMGDVVPLADLPLAPADGAIEGQPRALRIAPSPGRWPMPILIAPDGREARADAIVFDGCHADVRLGVASRFDDEWRSDAILRWHVEGQFEPLEHPERYRVAVVDLARWSRWAEAVACSDGVDDDGDGLVDLDDPGCASPVDRGEEDPLGARPACANGIDDDGDGRVDWPRDADCVAAGDVTEGPLDCVAGPATAVPDGSGGGFVMAPAVGDEARGRCQPPGDDRAEVVIPLRLERAADVTGGVFGDALLHARAQCAEPETEVACGESPLRLPAGDWWLFVEAGGSGRADLTVTPLAACDDGLDNDADGALDLDDIGCAHPLDDDEADPPEPPACANGIDDDGDGAIDHGPDGDADCLAAGGLREASCDGRPIIDYGDGLAVVDLTRLPRSAPIPSLEPSFFGFDVEQTAVAIEVEPGRPLIGRPEAHGVGRVFILDRCGGEVLYRPHAPFAYGLIRPGRYVVVIEWGGEHAVFPFRLGAAPHCADRIDNDGDGFVDLADPGCSTLDDTGEADPPRLPACGDGQDDDGDGLADWPADRGCRGRGDDAEALACPASTGGTIDGAGGRLALRRGASSGLYSGQCRSYGGAAVVQVIVDRRARLTATTQHSTFRPHLALRCNCHLRDVRGEIACDEARFPEREARIEVDGLEPGVYALVVDGFTSAEDGAVVEVAIEPF